MARKAALPLNEEIPIMTCKCEWQVGSPVLYFDPNEYRLPMGRKIRFTADALIYDKDENGDFKRKPNGQRLTKLETIVRVGIVKENYAGPCIQTGDTPEWQLLNNENVRIWDLIEWVGDD